MPNQDTLEQGFKQLPSPSGFPKISQLSRSCFINFSVPRRTLTYHLDKLHLHMNHNILYRFQGQKGGWNSFSKCFCLFVCFIFKRFNSQHISGKLRIQDSVYFIQKFRVHFKGFLFVRRLIFPSVDSFVFRSCFSEKHWIVFQSVSACAYKNGTEQKMFY